MGVGAETLLGDQELAALIAAHADDIVVVGVDGMDERLPEMARIFELERRLATTVAAARRAGRFPLVLAGNCISCLGTVAGVRDDGRLGVVWFDAHADFDTPEDNLSGFSDVMGLSILTGGSWRALRETIPGFAAIEETDVILAGTRDLEPYQRAKLVSSEINVVGGQIPHDALLGALRRLAERVDEIYLHVDLDVLDVSIGTANGYAASGGPDLAGLLEAIGTVFAAVGVCAASLTAYDPTYDEERRIISAARQIAARIAQGVSRQAG
jgi:arginase